MGVISVLPELKALDVWSDEALRCAVFDFTEAAVLVPGHCSLDRFFRPWSLYGRLPFAKRLCVLVDRKAAVLYPALLQVEPPGLDGIR